MNKNYYDLYINNVFSLAETLVIKSEDTASSINSVITTIYGDSSVDIENPSSWKYYKNISGQYHFTDKVMTITSLDTLQSIDFTIENLTASKSTKLAYQYGSRNYNELVSLYPDQELLILGILYPVNIDKAISSPDYTILSYPPNLVEDNEVSLILNIQTWIDKFKIRWHSDQFGVSDDLYTTTFLGLIYINLVPLILNLRLRTCKTNEVHSFHVRQYLASHGMLDIYLDNMTKKQALFFYRNIAYIERNNGKREIFYWLVEHVLTDRQIPLAEYSAKHDVSLMPNDIQPKIVFKKNSINSTLNASDRVRYDLQEMLNKEKELELGNRDYIDVYSDTINTKLKYSLSSVIKTKILESSVIDYTDATPYTFYETTLNLWMFLSSRDMYNVFVPFKNPKTGVTFIVSTKNAFAYFYYVFTKALGQTPVTIPEIVANRVPRTPTPTVADIMSVADTKYVTNNDATTLLSFMPKIKEVFTVEDFKNLSIDFYNAAQYQLKYTATAEHEYRRGLLKNMMIRNYCDTFCKFADTDTLYSQWLADNGLPIDDFLQSEYLDIYVQLFQAVTGSTFDNTASTRELQKAMLSIMRQLSSYSIQFIYETIGNNLKVLEHSAIRLGDRKIDLTSDVKVNDNIVDLSNFKASVLATNEIDTNSPLFDLFVKSPALGNYTLDLNVQPFNKDKFFEQTKIVPINKLDMLPSYQNKVTPDSGFIGYEVASLLTPEQSVDVYCKSVTNNIFKIDIQTLIIDTKLGGFNDNTINNNSLESFSFSDISISTPAFIDDKKL